MVDLHAAVILVAAEEKLAVEPDLPAVLAANPQLDGPRLVGVELRVGVAGDFLERAEGLVQVHHAVTRDLVQHVLKKGDASIKFGFAGTVQIDRDGDPGLQRVSRYCGFARSHRTLHSD